MPFPHCSDSAILAAINGGVERQEDDARGGVPHLHDIKLGFNSSDFLFIIEFCCRARGLEEHEADANNENTAAGERWTYELK
jgi:hypothetical protein